MSSAYEKIIEKASVYERTFDLPELSVIDFLTALHDDDT